MEEIMPMPLPLDAATPVGAGAYTDIVGIDAPSSAAPGAVVSITVRVKNTYSSLIGIMVGGALEYGVSPWPTINFPDPTKNVNAGATESFLGNFVMPNKDVIIHAYSYYYTTEGWYFDDERTIKVTVGVEQPVFSNLSVTYTRG